MSDLSGPALNRTIAERLGYSVIQVGEYNFHLLKDDTLVRDYYGYDSIDQVWERVTNKPYTFPDWSGDSADALALCLGIGEQRGYDLVMYRAKAHEGTVAVAKFFSHRDGKPDQQITGFACVNAAESLSRLALAALEAAR